MANLFVIAGPSGTGKGTITKKVLEADKDLKYSISATTRDPREHEVNGVDYIFLSHDEFEKMIEDDEFLEWFEVFGQLKGTPRQPVIDALRDDRDVLLELDVQGAMDIAKTFPEAILIFIWPPSRESQRKRLIERGKDSPDEIALRLGKAAWEESFADQFHHQVVNEDLGDAVTQIRGILADYRR